MPAHELNAYVDSLFGREDDLLREFRDTAAAEGLPQIQVPHELSRLLSVLVIQSRARRILEIGTLFGYSATVMARVLPPDGQIMSLELETRHAALARSNLSAAGLAHMVDIWEGPALDSLISLTGRSFDFVFIDADKANYPAYLDHAMSLVLPGSTIVADNVWRGGSVLQDDDDAAIGLARFNRMLADNARLRTAIVPTRGGEDAISISVVVT
ncbi:MAG: O-methyltransferase [Chloroflexota bacterium]